MKYFMEIIMKLNQLSFGCVLLSVMCALPASGQPITEDHKFVPFDGSIQNEFGCSVSISGNTAIIGARLDFLGESRTGAAYLYNLETRQHLFKLRASDASNGDQFGISVAISGNTAIVGADRSDDHGTNSGSAYIFDTQSGQQLFKLTASDANIQDRFGVSVAISGNIAIVGAEHDDGYTGAAYIFDTQTGEELFKLVADDADQNDFFGKSVAISGNTAIIGAPRDEDAGSQVGSVYIFDVQTGQQLFKVLPSDVTGSVSFGTSLAVSGNTAIVGGLYYAYLIDIQTGVELLTLAGDGESSPHDFGASVGISERWAMVGAPGGTFTSEISGSAYLFDLASGRQIAKFNASDKSVLDYFGSAVAISNSTLLVGAERSVNPGVTSGSAYLFEPSPCYENPSDLVNNGFLDFFDISAFLTLFANQDPEADINNDGNFDFFDISAFVTAFQSDCI